MRQIVIDDPKRPGKVITAGYLRVNSVHNVIQRTLDRQAEGGILEWPPNIPSDEVWIEAIEDKGGASSKLVLKFCCVHQADSVHHTVLLGLMDRVKDTYDFLKIAFGPLYQQISDIRRCGSCVNSIWRQRIPTGFIRRPLDMKPVVDERGADEIRKLTAAEKKARKNLTWRKPELIAPRPKALKLSPNTELPSTPTVRRIPGPTESPCPPMPSFSEILDVPLPAPMKTEKPLPDECSVCPIDDGPPLETRPDCWMCALPPGTHRSGRFTHSLDVCPCA